MPFRYYLVPAIILTLISLPLFLFSWYYQDVSFWENWILGEAGKYEEFCERNRMDQLIREPSNTFSNLAYVWLGLQVIAFAIYDKSKSTLQNRLEQWPVFSWLLGLALILLGAGSFFYHASLSRLAQRWDMTGVYTVMLILLIYTLFQFFPNRKKYVSGAVIVSLIGALLLYYFKWSLNGLMFLPAFIGSVLVFMLANQLIKKPRRNLKWAGISVVSLLSAFTLWYLDREKILCYPNSWFQGHAIWHCLTGWSVFSVYLYFRSEKKAASK